MHTRNVPELGRPAWPVAAAVARICAVIHTAQSEWLLHVATLAWVTAFLGFALTYGRLLVRRDPRIQAG
jgi:uncharacterized protein involved in response to NO